MEKIFQIWISSSKSIPDFVKSNTENIKKLYPECEHYLYDETKIKTFLIENFDRDVLLAYEKCKPFAFKSDLVRYCLLYIYGGYYFDISICPEFKLIHNYNAFALRGEDIDVFGNIYSTLDNGAMYFKYPKQQFLKLAIEKSVSNILSHNYGNHPLDVTGPTMLYRLDHSEVKLFPCSRIDDKVIEIDNTIWLRYPKGFSKLEEKENKKLGTNSYASMWFNGDVFKGSVQR